MTQRSDLLFILAEMVAQNLNSREGVYESGWIGVHKDAMMALVECGAMELVHDGFGRGYWAKFITEDNPLLSVNDALEKEKANAPKV